MAECDLPVDDVPHLFLLVLVLVQRRGARRDVVVGERHGGGMEEAAAPSGEGLTGQHVGGSDERHVTRPVPRPTPSTSAA